jgi:sirohydrochlorin cobaltochelatase
MCLASGALYAQTVKPVILVVSFGTSFNDSRAKTIGAIENAIATAYPTYEVRRAFTSQIIINHIYKRDKEKIDNIKQAMNRLKKDKVRELIVQPTLIMSGKEYDEMRKEIKPFEKNFTSVRYGEPLLTSDEDFTEAIKAITDATKQYVADDSAVVFMGHGIEHSANATYSKLAAALKTLGFANYVIGTVEAKPSLDDVIAELGKLGVKKLALLPFMIVAGDHANNDMAGDSDDSWKTILQSKSYAVTPIIRGLGENPAIQQIFVKHVDKAIHG